jgi:hypothetical protein
MTKDPDLKELCHSPQTNLWCICERTQIQIDWIFCEFSQTQIYGNFVNAHIFKFTGRFVSLQIQI